MLQQKDSHIVLQALFNRMDLIAAQCGDAFPLYSIADSDQWRTSKGGSWVGGFWSGCWWLRALVTGSAVDKEKAIELSEKLAYKIELDSINRGMIFWYGNGLAAQVFGHPVAQSQLEQAAQALCKSYDAFLQFIPVGRALGGGGKGHQTMVIDTLAPLLRLGEVSTNQHVKQMIKIHLDTLIEHCFCDNGAWFVKKQFDGKAFVSSATAGSWGRGQAWGILALAYAAVYWGESYISKAKQALDYWDNFIPTDMALDTLSQPEHDLSSMLIVGLATAILASAVSADKFVDRRQQYLHAVLNSPYFSVCSSDCSLDRQATDYAIFWGANANVDTQNKAMLETSWGLYFLMASLVVDLQLLQPIQL